MPGIVGFYGVTEHETAARLLPAMIRALGDTGCKVDTCTAPELGLARVHLDIIDHAPQPLWSDDGDVAVVMTGEIFTWDGLPSAAGHTAGDGEYNNARLVLEAYRQFGAAFAAHLNGSFAAAIWCRRERELLLASDHLGTQPLYYAQRGSQFHFGSGARAVAQLPGFARRADHAAIAEMVAFEQVLGDKTLYEGIRLLPPGSVLRFAAGVVHITRYADYQHPAYYERHDEDFYVEQWMHYLRQAVARQARPPFPLGMLLSGGLDSRALLGMHEPAAGPAMALTFGTPGCDDVRIAREVAQRLAIPHRYIPLPPDYLAHLAVEGVRITDGMKSCVHFNILGTLDKLVQETPVLYKGFLGGTLQGHVVTPDRLAPMRPEDAFAAIFTRRNHLFPEQEWPQLYTPPLLREVQSLPRQSLREALAQSQSIWPVDQESYVDLYQEDMRFTLLGVELARSKALVRIPMVDRDFVRFSLSVPPGYRLNKHYYKTAVGRAFPRLARVPVLPDGYPLVPCWRGLRLRADELARWWLRNHGVRWAPLRQLRPYANYALWLRTQLRSWVEQTLLAPTALAREYFKPDYVRNLVTAHMAGQDCTRRLSVLLTLELWHQQFID